MGNLDQMSNWVRCTLSYELRRCIQQRNRNFVSTAADVYSDACAEVLHSLGGMAGAW